MDHRQPDTNRHWSNSEGRRNYSSRNDNYHDRSSHQGSDYPSASRRDDTQFHDRRHPNRHSDNSQRAPGDRQSYETRRMNRPHDASRRDDFGPADRRPPASWNSSAPSRQQQQSYDGRKPMRHRYTADERDFERRNKDMLEPSTSVPSTNYNFYGQPSQDGEREYDAPAYTAEEWSSHRREPDWTEQEVQSYSQPVYEPPPRHYPSSRPERHFPPRNDPDWIDNSSTNRRDAEHQPHGYQNQPEMWAPNAWRQEEEIHDTRTGSFARHTVPQHELDHPRPNWRGNERRYENGPKTGDKRRYSPHRAPRQDELVHQPKRRRRDSTDMTPYSKRSSSRESHTKGDENQQIPIRHQLTRQFPGGYIPHSAQLSTARDRDGDWVDTKQRVAGHEHKTHRYHNQNYHHHRSDQPYQRPYGRYQYRNNRNNGHWNNQKRHEVRNEDDHHHWRGRRDTSTTRHSTSSRSRSRSSVGSEISRSSGGTEQRARGDGHDLKRSPSTSPGGKRKSTTMKHRLPVKSAPVLPDLANIDFPLSRPPLAGPPAEKTHSAPVERGEAIRQLPNVPSTPTVTDDPSGDRSLQQIHPDRARLMSTGSSSMRQIQNSPSLKRFFPDADQTDILPSHDPSMPPPPLPGMDRHFAPPLSSQIPPLHHIPPHHLQYPPLPLGFMPPPPFPPVLPPGVPIPYPAPMHPPPILTGSATGPTMVMLHQTPLNPLPYSHSATTPQVAPSPIVSTPVIPSPINGSSMLISPIAPPTIAPPSTMTSPVARFGPPPVLAAAALEKQTQHTEKEVSAESVKATAQKEQDIQRSQDSSLVEVYKIITQVGEGTFGKVYKARNQLTNQHVALKRIRMEGEKDGFPVTAMREIKFLQSLRHENVVRFYEMMVSKGLVYMVLEYQHHDLVGILGQTQIQLAPEHLKSIAQQMLRGLAYLHAKGVIHRDLKASNILLDRHGVLKLADFGLARFYQKRRPSDYTNRVITLWYRPPELLLGATIYGPEVDVWSAGCIFLELFVKKPTFQGNDEIHQLDVIFRLMGTPSLESWPGVSSLPWYELMKPADAIEGHFQHSFTKWLPPSALDLAERLLTFNPQSRITAEEALRHIYFEEDIPRALAPDLSTLEGEWHELESKRERAKKRAKAPKPDAEGNAPN